MKPKTKTITLEVYRTPKAGEPGCFLIEYRVKQVTDSTDYVPGQMLPVAQVKILCDAPRWKVALVTPKG